MSFQLFGTAYSKTGPKQKGHSTLSGDTGCAYCLCVLDKGPYGPGMRSGLGNQTPCPCDPFPQSSIRSAVVRQGKGDGDGGQPALLGQPQGQHLPESS